MNLPSHGWLSQMGLVLCVATSIARADIGFVDTARARVHVAYRAGSQAILRQCRPPVAPPVSRRCQTDVDEVKNDLSVLLNKLPYDTGSFERSASGLALLEKFLSDAEAESAKGNAEATKAVERLRRQRESLQKTIAFEGSLGESASSTLYEYNSDYGWLLALLGGASAHPYARLKVGDSIAYRSKWTISDFESFESIVTTKVLSKSGSSVELSDVTRAADGKETETKTTMDFTSPFPRPIKSPSDDVKFEKIGEGREALVVLGRKYLLDWIEYRQTGKTKEGHSLNGTTKIWYSADFPFGLAKLSARTSVESAEFTLQLEAVKAVIDGKTLGN